jgi:hypothetical protein
VGGGGRGAEARVGGAEARGVMWAWLASGAHAAAAAHAAVRQKNGDDFTRRSQVAEGNCGWRVGRLRRGGDEDTRRSQVADVVGQLNS